jgi:general secretion pathway protein C
VVQGPNEARGFVRRVGNSVGGRRIAFIGRNPREWSPAVWLVGTDGMCQAVLRDELPAPASISAAPRPGPAVSPPSRKAPPVLGPALASKVKNLGSGTFLVERAALETILGRATELLRRVKIRPTKMGEKVVGFELRRVAPGTLLDVLGLKNGDVLQSVNGFELTGPAEALQAYARLRLADNVRVKAMRNGVPVELEYRIR